MTMENDVLENKEEEKKKAQLPTLPTLDVNDSDACEEDRREREREEKKEREGFNEESRRTAAPGEWEEGTFIRFDARGRNHGNSPSIGNGVVTQASR